LTVALLDLFMKKWNLFQGQQKIASYQVVVVFAIVSVLALTLSMLFSGRYLVWPIQPNPWNPSNQLSRSINCFYLEEYPSQRSVNILAGVFATLPV
jgi:hypothetical protein